ncbi:MAG: magnesium and cobalt transport protein CorA [Demequinaceae bacterium]|nr:magnesium and cobalt transport protein CorA [Demequinaceae bacterium]
MAVIDNAVYVDGTRVAVPESVDLTLDVMLEHDGMGWVEFQRPSTDELGVVAAELGLHELAVEDALKGHQRPKLEAYDGAFSVVVRSARYVEADETVEFGDLHVFVGANYVVTVRQAPGLIRGQARKRLEKDPALLSLGPMAVLYAVLDEVVDGYAPVVAGLENDIDEIEDQIFGEYDSMSLSRRIYELHREVIAFQRAVQPLPRILEDLSTKVVAKAAREVLRPLIRDVLDHTVRINECVDGYRTLLDNALSVHATNVARLQTEASFAQNEEIKRISAWAAILFAPSLIGTVYGMNFSRMPELDWVYGYPVALGLMGALSFTLFRVFKHMKWL